MKKDTQITVAVTAGIVLVCIILAIFLTKVTLHQLQTECYQYGQAVDKETKYIRHFGCFVKTNGEWVPIR